MARGGISGKGAGLDGTLAPTAIVFPATMSVKAGQHFVLRADLVVGGHKMPVEAQYVSASTGVVKCQASGHMFAVAAGSAVVTASRGGLSATCTVTVVA